MIGGHGWGFLFVSCGFLLVLAVLIGVPYLIVKKVRASKAAKEAKLDEPQDL